MSRITEITVTMEMAVQPKQYQTMRLGLTIKLMADEGQDLGLESSPQALRNFVSKELREEYVLIKIPHPVWIESLR